MRRLVVALLAVSLLGCTAEASRDAGGAGGPRREVLEAGTSPLPVFSPAVRSGGLVFLSGQIGNKPGTTELVPGGIEAETIQTLDNIENLLGRIGLGVEDVVKCTVMLSDIEDYAAVNEVYRRYFPEDPPARSALAASGLALGAAVEIECIAAAR